MLEPLLRLAADHDRLEAFKLLVSVVSLISLVGIFAALLSMRVAVCHQVYARWQALLFKFADLDQAHEELAGAYSRGMASRPKAHFIAVAYVNLFEEAFRYRQARFAFVWRVLPEPFWASIVNSMTKQFGQYLYLRSFWEHEQDSFSSDFNQFIADTVLPQCKGAGERATG